MYELQFAAWALGPSLVALVVAYFVTRVRTDKEVEALADAAWEWTLDYWGKTTRTGRPGVYLKSTAWEFKGTMVQGLYKSLKLWRWVVWESVGIAKDRSMWDILVHEFTHSIDARTGEKRGHIRPPLAQAAARLAGSPL